MEVKLFVKNEGFKTFNYADLKDLELELSSRFIKIGEGAVIGHGAEIGSRAVIGHGAVIGSRAVIGYRAVIGEGAKIIKSLVLEGSVHPVIFYGLKLHIGCKLFSLEEWSKKYENIGLNEGYTLEQIKEYKGYIDICKNVDFSSNKF